MQLRRLAIFWVLLYIRTLSRVQLKKINPKIVGIGGASGKSSLSHILSIILSLKYKVRYGRGKNSETGIPLDILGISSGNYTFFDWIRIILTAPFKLLTNWERYDVYIAEMGIDGPFEPKNMSYLLKIVKPQTAALTNIAFEHSQYFDEAVETKSEKEREKKILELTKKEESKLLTSLPKYGLAVINMDDKNILSLKSSISSRTATVSIRDGNADFYGRNIIIKLDGFKMDVYNKGGKYALNLSVPVPRHYASSFLIGTAIAREFGISVKDSIERLSGDFSLPYGRFSVFEGIKNTTIIDSSYNNATLLPVLDILDFLKTVSGKRRKVVILGDIRELGSMGRKLHQIAAEKVLATCDLAILIGPLLNKYAAPVLRENSFNFFGFQTFTQAKKKILEVVEDNDVILVKGSQNTLFLERAVEMLLKNKKDKERLPRRGKFWDKQRMNTL